LLVDFGLGEAKVGDVEEADFVDGAEELVGKLLLPAGRVEE
jgi:hypothetical protein